MLRSQFLLFGDSITQRAFSVGGWANLLADSYSRKVDIINRGYSGYNTRWALSIIDHVLPLQSPPPIKLATVFFGANDAALPERASAKQHVPLDEYVANLRLIVQRLRDLNVAAIVLLTPPPISEEDRIKHVFATYGVKLEQPERTNEYAKLYAAAGMKLAEELDIVSVDLWNGFQTVDNWQTTLLNDGLHLTPEGNAKVYELLTAAIEKHCPHLVAEALPFDVPEWSDFVVPGVDAEEIVRAHVEKNQKS